MGHKSIFPYAWLFFLCLPVLLWVVFIPEEARSDNTYDILIKGALEYYQKSLDPRELGVSDLGEDGVLPMRPETARSFGFHVYEDENYRSFREKIIQGDEFMGKAIDAMKTTATEKKEGEHVAKVAHFACMYQKTIRSAEENVKKYRAALVQEKDDRFDKLRCAELLEKLLKEGLDRNSHNLRDAIGYAYNRTRDIEPSDGFPLTPENIRFVNHVFEFFRRNAKPEDMKGLDVDRVFAHPNSGKLNLLKRILGGTERRYLRILQTVLEKKAQGASAVEPLLFLALMRQESRFDPLSVSQVGAAGITQIMPATGLLLGMTSIFEPPYLKEARKVMLKERAMKAKALRLIQKPQEDCSREDARKARQFMQKSLFWKKKREALYGRYKRELLSRKRDDRLDPKKAIDAGYRLFSELMREQGGDISLALAAYNAGSRAVKKYGGLPPYAETVTFRNRVLRYYREYLTRMGWMPADSLSHG